MTPKEIEAIEKKFEDALCDLCVATDHQGRAIDFKLSPLIDDIAGRMEHLRTMNDGSVHSYTLTPGDRDNEE